jgi:hypothetical protein
VYQRFYSVAFYWKEGGMVSYLVSSQSERPMMIK